MTVALVTGANRGLGLEVCRQLADRDYDVILTARDEAKAKRACEGLWSEGLDTVSARALDVTSDGSIAKLRERVEQDFGELHVLVNNAGVDLDDHRSALDPDYALIEQTLATNLYGVLRVTAAFAPIIARSGHGRIVNVSSGMGALADMRGGAPGYRISKAGLNAVTRMLSAELPGVLVNSGCPGWARTDMGGPSAPSSVEQGADTLVWLATLPDDGPTGGFFRNREPAVW